MADQKKGRKVGRNKLRCAAYRTAQRREFNKARRLIRYLKRHPRNGDAWTALERVGNTLFTAQRNALGIAAILAGRARKQAA